MEIQKLLTKDFLDELHHLLWVEPFDNRGSWDEGWNCRDHALVVAAVCSVLGLRCSMVHGKVCFVQGPDGELPPAGILVDPHSWCGIDGAGFLDVSPRLTSTKDRAWRPWSIQAVLLNRCVPDGELRVVRSELEFQSESNRATHDIKRKVAVYFCTEYSEFTRKALLDAFRHTNSVLSNALEERSFDASIYAKAAVHLCKLLRGEAKSLRSLSQIEAWTYINGQRGDAIGWICRRAGID